MKSTNYLQGYASTLHLITLEEALEAIQNSLMYFKPDVEVINVSESPGRILAEDIYASRDIPSQDLAALDGIAVKSEDLSYASHQHPVRLLLKKVNTESIQSGEAAPIVTGMPLPNGADAVIRSERYRVDGDYVTIIERVAKGKDVIKKGEEVSEGEQIVTAGYLITPEIAAMLMELSLCKVRVFRKPKLAIIAVGDELCERYRDRGIEAVNYSYLISRKASEIGLDVAPIIVVPDEEDEVVAKLLELSKEYDVIFTSGGCSIGPNDIVPRAIKSIDNAKIIFHGVRCFPAKPTGFAIVNQRPVLMMPGHVVSMYVSFQIFGKKIISLLTGANQFAKVCQAVLDADVKGKPGLTSIVLLNLKFMDNEIHAVPLKSNPSSFRSLLKADGYILVKGDKELKAGDKVIINFTR